MSTYTPLWRRALDAREAEQLRLAVPGRRPTGRPRGQTPGRRHEGERLWTISHGTIEYGEKFVLRIKAQGISALDPMGTYDTIEEARAMLQVASTPLHRLERVPEDDPTLVESWAPKTTIARVLRRRAQGGAP